MKSVIEILESNKGHCVSGEAMAQELNMSRANIWKEIRKLRNQGFQIHSVKSQGYQLISYDGALSKSNIMANITAHTLEDLRLLHQVGSTNDVAKQMAEDDALDHLLILSDQQTHGKGRKGRSFYSPDRNGIYMSLLIRPDLAIRDAQLLTICSALAVCHALESLYGLSPKIKWLNDVYLNGRKICGILTEGEIILETYQYRYLVIGIGINVYDSSATLPENLDGIYTSIEHELGVRVDRNTLVYTVINAFYAYYFDLSDRTKLIEHYKLRSNVLGKTVFINDQSTPYQAIDITQDGHLIVTDNTETLTLNAGEISIQGDFK